LSLRSARASLWARAEGVRPRVPPWHVGAGGWPDAAFCSSWRTEARNTQPARADPRGRGRRREGNAPLDVDLDTLRREVEVLVGRGSNLHREHIPFTPGRRRCSSWRRRRAGLRAGSQAAGRGTQVALGQTRGRGRVAGGRARPGGWPGAGGCRGQRRGPAGRRGARCRVRPVAAERVAGGEPRGFGCLGSGVGWPEAETKLGSDLGE
jgi:hypothetical protein